MASAATDRLHRTLQQLNLRRWEVIRTCGRGGFEMRNTKMRFEKSVPPTCLAALGRHRIRPRPPARRRVYPALKKFDPHLISTMGGFSAKHLDGLLATVLRGLV
jgi:hypothetical protein